MKRTEPEKPASKELIEAGKRKDIIVTRVQEVEEVTPEGILKKRIERKINLTKKINETAKVLKQATALEKIEKAEKELIKKGVY